MGGLLLVSMGSQLWSRAQQNDPSARPQTIDLFYFLSYFWPRDWSFPLWASLWDPSQPRQVDPGRPSCAECRMLGFGRTCLARPFLVDTCLVYPLSHTLPQTCRPQDAQTTRMASTWRDGLQNTNPSHHSICKGWTLHCSVPESQRGQAPFLREPWPSPHSVAAGTPKSVQ